MWTTECVLKYSRKGLRNLMLHLPHYAVFFWAYSYSRFGKKPWSNQKFAHDNTTMIIFRPQVWRRRTYICFLITTECVPLIMIRFTRSHTHCGWALREPKRRKRSLSALAGSDFMTCLPGPYNHPPWLIDVCAASISCLMSTRWLTIVSTPRCLQNRTPFACSACGLENGPTRLLLSSKNVQSLKRDTPTWQFHILGETTRSATLIQRSMSL